ncbi:MAG: site-2 protease family protein [Acidobacteria bacterium]|nr:site-2 protease family protein [Acidobacteriota bacterium]
MTTTLEQPPPPPVRQEPPEDLSSSGFRLAGVAAATLALGLLGGLSVLLVVLAIVVMIFMHELGHYLTARAADMKVTEFFIGFGPRIWSFSRGETEYGVKAIPAGAYVRIIGMTNLDEVDEVDEPRTYRNKPYWRRMSVALAGSAMHFMMAIIMLFIAFVVVGINDSSRWHVNDLTEGSPAAQGGIEVGDQVVELGGVEIARWGDLVEGVEPLAGRTVEVIVDRGGELVTLDVTIGERLSVDGAAGIDGAISGDIIRSVDDVEVDSYDDYLAAVTEGEDHQIVLLRGTDVVLVDAHIDEKVTEDPTFGLLGVTREYERVRLGFAESVTKSFTDFGSLSKNSIVALGTVFSPSGLGDFVSGAFDTGDDGAGSTPTASNEIDPSDRNRVLSIVGGVRIGAQATDDGVLGFLSFMITINIFVGVFNLVPLLPLDGGHVAIATYEKIRSRGGRNHHADVGKLMPLTYAVVSLLVVIGLIAVYRDIVDPVNLPT